LLVNGSPFDPTRTTGNLVSDFNLTLTGVGAAKAFRIGAGQTLAKTGAGVVSVNGDQLHAPGAVLAVNQGTVNLNTDGGMNNGGTPVSNLSVAVNNGAVVNFGVTQHLAQVTVTSGLAKLTSASPSGSRAIDATGVLASGGRLDLTNGRLIVDYAAGNSPMASIQQQIVSGYNALGTLWGGNGIVSSSAAGDPTTGLGYGEASDLLGPAGGTFGSEVVDGDAVLVRYTKIGDANLDGSVGFNDLVRLAQNYNSGGGAATWAQGDFTYDGFVDFNDLVKLAQNYNGAVAGAVPGAPVSFDQDLAAAFALAPEPGTMGLVGGVVVWGLARRRRVRGRSHWQA
jgi:PEP-CTERM motif